MKSEVTAVEHLSLHSLELFACLGSWIKTNKYRDVQESSYVGVFGAYEG